LRPLACYIPALALLLAPSTCSQARAQGSSPEDLARHHHARGTSLYNLGQFEEAINEYRRGYEQKADPVFLYNIAGAYRQLGAPDKALFFYRRYLTTAPDSANRRQVETLIVDLDRLVAAEQRARSPAPPQPLSGVTTVANVPFVEPPGSGGPPSDRPLWHRWGFWAGLGTLVAGGLVLGILVMSSSGGQPPRTDLGAVRFF
jgi:tetratricopeptide (TPR) repeat protein